MKKSKRRLTANGLGVCSSAEDKENTNKKCKWTSGSGKSKVEHDDDQVRICKGSYTQICN